MAWPSGKAEACKASIPSSNLGATLLSPLHSMLYLIATPIGNLQDITIRALEILKTCDYVLCEDTRHSQKLLSHYDLHKHKKSYHLHNEKQRIAEVLDDLKNGKAIALITDAGTPGISDPGQILVRACRQEGLPVQSIAGACAAILALTASGLETDRFQFMGFLPKKSGELQKTLQEALVYSGTSIFYESPQRILTTLKKIDELAPERIVAIARELTKTHEEHLSGTAKELLARWDTEDPRGEIVLMISGETEKDEQSWVHLDPKEHVLFLEETYKMPRNEAIKLAAKMRGVSKSNIYNLYHKIQS